MSAGSALKTVAAVGAAVVGMVVDADAEGSSQGLVVEWRPTTLCGSGAGVGQMLEEEVRWPPVCPSVDRLNGGGSAENEEPPRPQTPPTAKEMYAAVAASPNCVWSGLPRWADPGFVEEEVVAAVACAVVLFATHMTEESSCHLFRNRVHQ